MKTSLIRAPGRPGLMLVLLASLLAALPGRAQTPQYMTYQGYLTDQNGGALGTNGPQNYDIVFRIWNQPTGGSTPLYGELQTVTVANGYFSVLLGQGSAYVNGGVTDPRPPLSTVFTTNNLASSARYVEMTVKGLNSGADVTILPRLQLVTVPYSFMAANANTLVSATAGTNILSTAGNNVTLSGNLTNSGGSIFMDNGQIIAAKNTAGVYETFLWPRWTDNETYLNYGSAGFNIRNNSGASTMFLNNGDVGIGTTTPGFPLTFLNTTGDKISLWGQSGNSIGLGVQGSLLQIHSDVPATDIAFGYGSSAAMTETMRIKGTGRVGIGTSSPGASLQVNGGILARGGTPGANGGNNNGYAFSGNSGDDDTGMFSTADGTLQFFVNDNEVERFAPSGLVGIDTTTPGYNLDVNGSFHANSVNSSGGATLTGGYTYLNPTADASGGNAAVGSYGYSNVKLTVKTTESYGIFVDSGASGDAAYFTGNVGVSGTLSKGGGSFKIDHPLDPENKWLYHSFVESPDMMNVYNGNTTTDEKGEATVILPDYFQALNKDFRYQLTVIGQFAQAIVSSEISSNSTGINFGIKTDKPNVKVSWQVTGVRQDPFANAHRIIPEVAKTADEAGTYLYPAELGKPESKRMHIGKGPLTK